MPVVAERFDGATGDAPPHWTATLVGTGAAFAIQNGVGLRMRTGTGFNGGTAIYDAVRLPPGQGSLRGAVTLASLVDSGYFFTVQLSGDRGTVVQNGYTPGGYSLKLDPNAGAIEVARQPGISVLQNVSGITFSTTRRMWFQLQIVGVQILARVWLEGDAIPAWQINTTDTASALTADSRWVTVGWKGLVDLPIDLHHLAMSDLSSPWET